MRGSKTRSGLNAITDPAVYKRIAELFSQAAELPLQDQAAFLRDKSGSDTDLLRLVQNLLLEDRQGVIEPQLGADRSIPVIPEDLSGRTLSHYRSFDRWELVEWESFTAQRRRGSSEPSR